MLGFGVELLGLGVELLGFGVELLGFGVELLGFGVELLGFWGVYRLPNINTTEILNPHQTCQTYLT